MPTVGSNTGDDAAEAPRSTEPGSRPTGGLLRRLGWSTAVLCAVAALLMGAGFFWFIWRVPADEVALDRNADGIVALTGGASRIADAIELLGVGPRQAAADQRRLSRDQFQRNIAPQSGICALGALLRRLRPVAQHAGQRDRDQALGRKPRLPLADRGDVELPHAARARRDRASASRRCAGAFPGGNRAAACRPLVGARRRRRG